MKTIKNDKFKQFNPKDIFLTGWIKDQLQTQINGLTGNLHRFWPDIKDSAWIGGNQDSWERVPYWLDGYIPLAYLLKDKEAIKVAKFYVNNILKRQENDGWIAPCSIEKRSTYDVWGIFIILKALLNYALINNDKKVYHAIYMALKSLNEHIDKYPLFEWAKQRWYECYIPIFAIYKKYKEEWLLDLALKLFNQGFDFITYYKTNFLRHKEKVGNWNLITHIVNNVMAVKSYALVYKMSKLKKDLKKSDYILNKMNKYHGAVTGAINGDECFSGKSPIQGSELCSIVELMYSLETLINITGDPKYIEQLERLAFNALPSALTNDMWAHQYDNQVNAPFIKKHDIHPWTSNGSEANLYGLEPHFGCCTANFHQGWPKFTLNMVQYDKKGLVVSSYCPINIKNKKYEVSIDSYYPFDTNNITIKVISKKECEIKLYKPVWAKEFKVNNTIINDKKGYVIYPLNKGENIFIIDIEKEIVLEDRYKENVSIIDGPIVYALKVEQRKERINVDDPLKSLPHGDFEFINESDFAFRMNEFKYDIIYNDVDKNKSPFVSEKVYKELNIELSPVKYMIIGNYALLYPNIVTGENKICKFSPIGVYKLHMGEIYKVR